MLIVYTRINIDLYTNMKKTVTNIEYDTDNEEVDLPTTLEIRVPDHITDEEEVEEFISDEISNITGFCHTGFNVD